MLKSISVSSLLVLFSLLINVQLNGQVVLLILILGDKVVSEDFHLSIDGGLNISNLSGSDNGKAAIGPYFGLGTHLKLTDHWFLAPEFKPLSFKGVRDVDNPIDLSDEYINSEVDSKIRLNYKETPVLGQYWFNNGLYLSAGPQVSFLVSAKQETEIILPSGTLVDVEQNLKDNFQGVDFSLPFEIGYAISSIRGSKRRMDLRSRYTPGLSEVFDENTGLSANNSTFQFFVTFPFVEVDKQ